MLDGAGVSSVVVGGHLQQGRELMLQTTSSHPAAALPMRCSEMLVRPLERAHSELCAGEILAV